MTSDPNPVLGRLTDYGDSLDGENVTRSCWRLQTRLLQPTRETAAKPYLPPKVIGKNR